ncbi:MAG: NAD(+) synthase [Actinomycetota bacterium]|nr:NAD(+) synthase [Actinomycetota bacterium]
MENNLLEFDLEISRKNIVGFIRKYAKDLNRQGAVVGLSGGIDSSLVLKLCVEALGHKNVIAVMLPERDSGLKNINDAKKFAKELGVRIIYKKITGILSFIGVYSLYPPTFFFKKSFIEKYVRQKRKNLSLKLKKDLFLANLEGGSDEELSKASAFYRIKHRLRSTILFYYSELNNYLLVGCANKSEWLTGFFVKYGDSIADIMPIISLYKTQVFSLSEYLGLPDYIIEKAPSPDLIPGLVDEELLGISYKKLDLILSCFEKGYPTDRIIQISGATDEEIKKVSLYMKKSDYLREWPIRL